jgi:hypothetical protein
MMPRWLVLALGIAAISAPSSAPAQADRPVSVRIVGHGAIRFRLAGGAVAPCESSENRMLFDGWLEPGQYVFSTGADLVCYEHTSGALRESNWSTPRVVPTTMGRRLLRRPQQIEVSTE